MAKPQPTDISANEHAWDATVRDNFRIFSGGDLPTQNPMPIPEIQDGDPLPDAAAFARCIVARSVSSVWVLYFSDGTSWKEINLS